MYFFVQGAKATAAGEECISNIRTVRAFAMEDIEMEMYSNEVDKSRDSYELLGLGIGLFQVRNNLAPERQKLQCLFEIYLVL